MNDNPWVEEQLRPGRVIGYALVALGVLGAAWVLIKIVAPLSFALLVAGWFVVPPVWVYMDAVRRGATVGVAVLWSVFTVLTASVGAVVYLLVSRADASGARSCPGCRHRLEPDYRVCPECGTPAQRGPSRCPSCDGRVESGWKFCPFCQHGLG